MLFDGIKGCFSPLVSSSVRSLWVRNGGTIMLSEQEFYQTSCFFCADIHDPWVKRLSEKSVIVLHASWVSNSIEEQSSMPVSRFVLDDFSDPTQMELSARPLTPKVRFESPNSSFSCDDAQISPSTASKNEHASRLKRPFYDMNSSDQDVNYSPERIRPTKRQRVHFSSTILNHDVPKTTTPKSCFITGYTLPASKTDIGSQNQVENSDVSQGYESSVSSCSNSCSDSCLSYLSISQPRFPRVNLARLLSMTRRDLKSVLKPRSKFLLNVRYDSQTNQSPSIGPCNEFMSFWTQVANQKRSNVTDEDRVHGAGITSNHLVIAVSSIPKISSSPGPSSSTIFLPKKVHLGKPFAVQDGIR